MRIKQLFLTLALLCAVVQGAWAQANWEEVYAMTGTTSANWTALTEGSTSGKTIGTQGNTTYYYTTIDLSFTNNMVGGSGLTIEGTVYLYVPQGVTVTCTGADASGRTGAGAGIELPWGNALYLIGQGSVSATGGNAANGGNGANGTDANWDSSNYWSGTGGNGGDGGGGAGAGIGTPGGTGGKGGAGAASTVSAWSNAGGKWGNPGQAGATYPMGELCVSTSIESLTATGGAAATTSGSAGSAGKAYLYDGTSYNYSAAGGGGGGGGGFGGAASNIGTGGPGGGGGGGGASSNLDWASSGYYVVKAPGGKGGQNANGTWAAAGGESIMNHDGLKNGQVITNGSGWADDAYNYDRYVSHQNLVTGGSGGICGPASTSGSAIRLNPSIKHPTQEEWDVLCSQTLTTQSQWTELPFGTPAGTTLGTAGTTTYYYATGDRLFANTVGSGLTILGTVYIYIQSGQTITCKGAHASGATGAGAGIELAEGNTLHLLGSGTLNATGGNAANGGNGANGDDVNFVYNQYCQPGSGGNGGDGGGGAGAGIGTPGGNGGSGGTGGIAKRESNQGTNHGVAGNVGGDGSTAGPMGTLYAASDITLNVRGGNTASSGGAGGNRGKNAAQNPYNQYTASGGGGGGGGGFGGAASNIGTGGPGGGAGGGGAAGNSEYYAWAYGGFYRAGAGGGTGGRNANGSSAANGTTSELGGNNIYAAEFIGGFDHADSDGFNDNDYGWYSGNEMLPGGSGGAPGSASISSTVNRTVNWPTAGAGTAESPYTISSAEEWNTFASRVNNGTKYSGQHVKLTANISVSAMAGSSETRSFQGTFDGDSHTLTINVSNQPRFAAPFKYVDGATIQNLRVAGSINGSGHADGKLLSGLVGYSNGNTTITNCVSSATLTTDFGADAELAGIVAATGGGSLTISGCVFNGSMAGAANTGCAGIAGAEFAATTTTITNALFAPATLTVSTADDGKAKTISRDADAVITNCYFTKALGTEQGAQAATPSTAFTGLGSPITEYGMVTAYAKGILFDGTYYGTYATISLADNADNRTTISDANGYVADVTLTGRTLYRDGDWNTLCLPFSLDNIYGTCLQGATVKTLESTSFSDGTLTMNFTENVSSIEAGKPYIVKWKPVDLSTLTTHYTAQDGETLTGTLGGNYKISIAAGATVKLQDVTINGTNDQRYSWAGISCLGNATIILKGTNDVWGFYGLYPGIHVPSGSTLTIKGSGSLTAHGRGNGAGIGAGWRIPCGNIVIEGGTINAYGGQGAAGIGGARYATCGFITITDGVTKVYAQMGGWVGAIGTGYESSCGTVTIGGEETNITASTYTYTGTGSGSVDVAVPNLVNPEFKSVIISDAPANVSTDYVDFVGTYSSMEFADTDYSILLMGAANMLYYPTTGAGLGAQHAYFKIGGDGAKARRITGFSINFGDGETTGIISAEANSSLFTIPSSLSDWYTIHGVKLDGKPTRSGIYIHNGVKVVIK